MPPSHEVNLLPTVFRVHVINFLVVLEMNLKVKTPFVLMHVHVIIFPYARTVSPVISIIVRKVIHQLQVDL